MVQILKSRCKLSLVNALRHHVHQPVPFDTKQFVFTQDNLVASALKQQLLNEQYPYLMGMEFVAFSQWAKVFLSGQTDQFLLSKSLMEIALCQKIDQSIAKQDPVMYPISQFINGDIDKKLSLVKTLANCFLFYGLFAKESLLQWQKEQGWQQSLWAEIAKDYPALTTLLDKAQQPQNLSLHLYAPTFLPNAFLQWLMHLPPSNTVFFYLFTPCNIYWDDVLSDKMKYRILSKTTIKPEQLHALDQMTSEVHTLLGAWGAIGKQLHRQLSDEIVEELEEPALPSTILGTVCNAISTGINPTYCTLFKEVDRSFSVHATPSLTKESALLITHLMEMFENDPSLGIHDVAILVSDVAMYAPILQLLVKQKQLPFGFSYEEIPVVESSLFLQNIQHLLELLSNPFSLDAWRLFCLNPFFLQKHRKTKSEVNTFFSIAIQCGMPQENTPEQNIISLCDRLLNHLCMVPTEQSATSIALTYAEELGEWITFLQYVAQSINSVKQAHDPQKWAQLLLEWVAYFFPEASAIDENVYHEDFCRKVHELCHLKQDTPFTFAELKPLVHSILTQKKRYAPFSDHGLISVGSFGSGALYPCKHLFMLGCSDQHLPKVDPYSSLNALRNHPKTDPFPPTAALNKYFLLEALFTPSRSITLSYSQEENKESVVISPLLNELFHHLDAYYRVCSQKPSQALLFLHKDNGLLTLKKNETQKAKNLSLSSSKAISWRTWVEMAKHPIRCFCKESLSMDVPFLGPNAKDEEIFISYLTRSQHKEYCKDEVNKRFMTKKHSYALPQNNLFTLAHWEVNEQQHLLHEKAATLNLINTPRFTLYASFKHHKISQEGASLLSPPISLQIKNEEVFLEGKISNITHDGLIIFGKGMEAVAKQWGVILLWYMSTLPPSFTKEWLYIVEDEKKIPLTTLDLGKGIKKYADYVCEAMERPSFLIPSLMRYALKDQKRLTEVLHSQEHEDTLLQWYVEHHKENLESHIATWEPTITNAFSPIDTLWSQV